MEESGEMVGTKEKVDTREQQYLNISMCVKKEH